MLEKDTKKIDFITEVKAILELPKNEQAAAIEKLELSENEIILLHKLLLITNPDQSMVPDYLQEPLEIFKLEIILNQNLVNSFSSYVRNTAFDEDQVTKKLGNLKQSLLCFAARIGDLESVKTLLATYDGEKVAFIFHHRDANLQSPLHLAAMGDNPEVISILLEAAYYKTDELFASDINGYTPLHLAIQKGNIEAVKMLLNAAGDKKIELLTQKAENGKTPLEEAALLGDIQIIKQCLSIVGNIDQFLKKDQNGHRPIKYLTDTLFKEVFNLERDEKVSDEVLHAVRSHTEYWGTSMLGKVANVYNNASAVILRMIDQDCEPDLQFQQKVNSAFNQILRYPAESNQGLSR